MHVLSNENELEPQTDHGLVHEVVDECDSEEEEYVETEELVDKFYKADASDEESDGEEQVTQLAIHSRSGRVTRPIVRLDL